MQLSSVGPQVAGKARNRKLLKIFHILVAQSIVRLYSLQLNPDKYADSVSWQLYYY